jgi:hypothetical protein
VSGREQRARSTSTATHPSHRRIGTEEGGLSYSKMLKQLERRQAAAVGETGPASLRHGLACRDQTRWLPFLPWMTRRRRSAIVARVEPSAEPSTGSQSTAGPIRIRIRFDPIRSDPIRSNSIRSDPMLDLAPCARRRLRPPYDRGRPGGVILGASLVPHTLGRHLSDCEHRHRGLQRLMKSYRSKLFARQLGRTNCGNVIS